MRIFSIILAIVILMFVIYNITLVARLLAEPSTRWPVIGFFGLLFSSVVIYFYVSRRVFLRGYKKRLEEINGQEWFIYTTKKTSQKFVEQNILPALEPAIKVMKLKEGVFPWENNEFGSILSADFLREIKRRRRSLGFPCLIKIIDGEVVDVSLRDELYATISRNLTVESFIKTLKKSLIAVRSNTVSTT